MTVTINKMSAGKGYEYLLRTVAVGDGDRSLAIPLTRYYNEAGTPPGHWMGSGLLGLECAIYAGDEVTEDQLKRLIGPRPADRASGALWDQAAITIAAYRDRYAIDDRTTLGPKPATDSQRLDRARALDSVRRAERVRPSVSATDSSAALVL